VTSQGRSTCLAGGYAPAPDSYPLSAKFSNYPSLYYTQSLNHDWKVHLVNSRADIKIKLPICELDSAQKID